MKVIIVDDEQRARVSLQYLISEFLPEVEIVAECDGIPNAVKAIHKHKPDLVFLDIEMPGHSGLEILDFIQKRRNSNPNALDIRIGIHSGPVIAGIVGVKKFAYDIWGDTVNTAARMEQNSQKGKVNISESTYQMIKDRVQCEYRGKIEVKGKGDLDMYFAQELNKD